MVTIVVPYIEDRGYLDRCLSSIEAQTYPDIEIITVKSPLSVSKNINIGLKKAKGEFFKEVGEDDWLPPNSIADLVEGIQGHDWVCANAINVAEGIESREIPLLENLMFENMVRHNAIHNGTTLHRTKILREVGGMDESLWTAEEYELHLRMMKRGYLPHYIDKFVYFYQIWRGQKSLQLRRADKHKRDEEIKRIQALYSDPV